MIDGYLRSTVGFLDKNTGDLRELTQGELEIIIRNMNSQEEQKSIKESDGYKYQMWIFKGL